MDQTTQGFSHLLFAFIFDSIHLNFSPYLFSKTLSQNFCFLFLFCFLQLSLSLFLFLLFETLRWILKCALVVRKSSRINAAYDGTCRLYINNMYTQPYSRAISAHLLMKKLWSSRHIWDNSALQTAPDIVYTASSSFPRTSITWSIWAVLMDYQYGTLT